MAVNGIDMVHRDPSAYAMSIGPPREREDPELKADKRKAFGTALQVMIQPRTEINNPDQAKRHFDLGVRPSRLGTDISVIHSWFRENGGTLQEATQEAQ